MEKFLLVDISSQQLTFRKQKLITLFLNFKIIKIDYF